MEWKILPALALLVLLLGCSMKDIGGRPSSPGEVDEEEDAVKACKELCKAERAKGTDLSSGQCLSTQNPDWEIKGWVCDMAHSPRKEVDNLAENQCPEFNVTISRFVEVSEQCTLIKARG